MVEMLKKERRLVVLRLSMDRVYSRGTSRPTPTTRDVLLTLEVGDEQMGEPVRVKSDLLHVPRTLDEVRGLRGYEPAYTLPADTINQVRSLAQNAFTGPETPLWLQFGSASGNLPLLRWERLLQPGLSNPLVRLPYFYLEPFTDTGPFVVALCASAPMAKTPIPIFSQIDRVIVSIGGAINRPTIVHVFADANEYANLLGLTNRGYKNQDGTAIQITVHDPHEAADYPTPRRSAEVYDSTSYSDSPWLNWMTNKLSGQSTDLMHFFCHGYLSLDTGAIAFAQSPTINTDPQMARFIGPRKLSAFLNEVGAWSVGFTCTPDNYSVYGLRLLADQVARTRPGPVFLQEADWDVGQPDLMETYGFLFNKVKSQPKWTGQIALYCHPNRFQEAETSGAIGPTSDTQQDSYGDSPYASKSQEVLSKYTLAQGETGQLLNSQYAPPWMRTSQRYLEQTAAQLLGSEDDSESADDPVRKSIEEALSFTKDVLARHAIKESTVTKGEGEGDTGGAGGAGPS